MKKYAVIDIGTNSMRLLLAEIQNNKVINRKKYINTSRIGSSVDKNKIISKEGIRRNIQAFYQFIEKAKEYGADEILAIATSALRDAKNKEEFIEKAYEKTGINIKIISGEEEAILGYKGVIMGIGDPNLEKNQDIPANVSPPTTIVIDIGGGSTELIIGKGSRLKKTISMDIGAVRMTERFISTDPISKAEQEEMERAIYKILKGKIPDFHVYHSVLLGIGGTITSLAALDQELDPYDPEKIHNYKLTIENIKNLKEKLVTLRVDQIKELRGIEAKRADIIVGGITILSIIMKELKLNEITVSEYDNLEGLLFTACS